MFNLQACDQTYMASL